MTGAQPFSTLVAQAVAEAGVPELLARRPGGAVVLERLARAAGATRWFTLRDEEQLAALTAVLSPGSAVSFYFDGRIAPRPYDHDVAEAILRIAEMDGDSVVGTLAQDEVEIDVDFVAGPSDLEDFERELSPGATIFYGRFPGRDNDGDRAITLDLPDRDGVIRPHPH